MTFISYDEDGNEIQRSATELFEESRQRRTDALAGKVMWNRWRYSPDTQVLELLDERGEWEYEVPLVDCTTSAQVLDWICQVTEKTWADDAVIAGLVRAIDEILTPQGTLCGSGIERGPIDVREMLTPPSAT